VHVKDDYDDRYQFELPFHKKNLMNVVKFVLKCINGKYVFFEVPSCNLRRYATSKSAHAKMTSTMLILGSSTSRMPRNKLTTTMASRFSTPSPSNKIRTSNLNLYLPFKIFKMNGSHS
jgi:hypothetical protein